MSNLLVVSHNAPKHKFGERFTQGTEEIEIVYVAPWEGDDSSPIYAIKISSAGGKFQGVSVVYEDFFERDDVKPIRAYLSQQQAITTDDIYRGRWKSIKEALQEKHDDHRQFAEHAINEKIKTENELAARTIHEVADLIKNIERSGANVLLDSSQAPTGFVESDESQTYIIIYRNRFTAIMINEWEDDDEDGMSPVETIVVEKRNKIAGKGSGAGESA